MSYADPLAVLIDALVHADGDAVDAAYAALPTLDAARVTRTTISNRQRRDTFERDHYQCLYCGSKLILSDVLALLAVIDPQRYPWHRSWRVGTIHPAFPSSIATVDHVRPVVLGGGNEPDNLVTACWPCNHRKLDFDVAQPLVDPADGAWRGLTDRYRALWERAGNPEKFRWSVEFFSPRAI